MNAPICQVIALNWIFYKLLDRSVPTYQVITLNWAFTSCWTNLYPPNKWLYSGCNLLYILFLKQLMIPWYVNWNPNRNLNKSIGILIGTEQSFWIPVGTWTINTSRGHNTTCTPSQRAQNYWSHKNLGKIYITCTNAWTIC